MLRPDTKFKVEVMKDWNKRATDPDQNAITALLEVAEAKDKLSRAAKKWNERGGQGRWRLSPVTS